MCTTVIVPMPYDMEVEGMTHVPACVVSMLFQIYNSGIVTVDFDDSPDSYKGKEVLRQLQDAGYIVSFWFGDHHAIVVDRDKADQNRAMCY